MGGTVAPVLAGYNGVLEWQQFMFETGSMIGRLLGAPMGVGRVVWIGVRVARRGGIVALEEVVLDPAEGVVGDRYAGRSGGRQVTLMQAEHLGAIGAYLGTGPVAAARLRRNLVVAGINLLALKEQRVVIGGAVLEVTGVCAPCSRMEEELGAGGYNAVRGHGGVTARVVSGGVVRIGDGVERMVP